MSEVRKRICDRCKGVIVSSNKTAITLRKSAKLNITENFGFGPYEYSTDSLDLCNVCTKELKRFLSGSEVKDNE